MDIVSMLGALRTAADSVREMQEKMVAPCSGRSSLLDSYETLVENYCNSNGLQWHKEGTAIRDTHMFHIIREDFRLGIQLTKDAVGEIWVFHPLKMHPEGCPKIGKALRMKDMEEFHEHINGLQNMYSLSPERNKRQNLFLCLTNLENDLMNINQHILQWEILPLEMNKISPFGLLVPRAEGKPLRLGFFVAPSDLVERDGTLMKPDFYVLGARKIGLWASVTVTAVQSQVWLPTTRTFRRVFRSEEGTILCEFAPLEENNPVEVPGTFVLSLNEPMIITDRVVEEIRIITGYPVPAEYDSRQPLLQLLHDQFFTGKQLMSNSKTSYMFVIAGQHHSYTLSATNELACRVSEIRFAHPSVLPSVLNTLRRQATINKLLSGCMRNVSQDDIINPFAFDVVYTSPVSLVVEFSHPLNCSSVRAEISLAENGTPFFLMKQSLPSLCTDVSASTWLRKTLSMPVILKTMIERFAQSYVHEPVKPVARTGPPRTAHHTQKTGLSEVEMLPSLILQHAETLTLTPIQKTAPSITALLERSTPPLLSQASVNQSAKGNKMEKMLMERGGKVSSVSRDKTVSPKSMTMDKSEHTKKLKALYETNEKKQSMKTKRKAESFDLELKPKKRKSMADVASTSSAVSSKSDSSSSLDNFIELTKPVASPMGKIRIAKSEISPHGSPITIKLIKQPSSDSNMQAVFVNKEPKKKKVKPTGPPEPKKQKKGLQLEVHQAHVPELPKKPKKDPISDTPELITELKKPKKEVTEFAFLPEQKPSKFKAELGDWETHLLQSKKGSPSKSPTERKSSAAVSAPNAKVMLLPTKLPGSSAALAVNKLKEGSSKTSTSAYFPPLSSKSPVPPYMSPSKSPIPGIVNSSAAIFQLPKTPSLSYLPRIPKKNANALSASAKPVLLPMSSLTVPLISHVTPAQVAHATEQLLDSIFAVSPALSVTSTSPSINYTRIPLLPTPNIEPSPPITEKLYTQPFSGSSHIQTPLQGPHNMSLVDATTKSNAESGIEKTGRPNPGLVIDIPPMNRDTDNAKRNTTGVGTPGETITSPSVKGRNPRSLSAVLDRLKSKTRLDSGPDNSGDSSDVQDVVFKQLTSFSDTPDGKERSDNSLIEASASMTNSAESAEGRMSTPTKMTMLVPYDDTTDDDTTLDETIPQASPNGKDIPRMEVQSPEIFELRSIFRGKLSVLADDISGPSGPTQPTSAADIAALTASPPPMDSLINAPDRTSPVILDDELLDAAFLSPETDDRS